MLIIKIISFLLEDGIPCFKMQLVFDLGVFDLVEVVS